MPEFSKPCGVPGCPGRIVARGPRGLADRVVCSRSCAYQWRVLNGWKPPVLTREQRLKGGRIAGRVSGEVRRRKAAIRVAEQIERFIDDDMREALSYRGLLKLRVMLCRAFKAGRNLGVQVAANSRLQRARSTRNDEQSSERVRTGSEQTTESVQ